MRPKTMRSGIETLFVLLLIGLFPASGNARSKPDWIENPAAFYSSSDFMIGVGEGDDIEKAKAKALAEISSIFNSKIREVVESRDTLKEVDGKVSSTSEIDVKTQLVTAADFEGAEVKKRWCCESGRHYVLTVLERSTYTRNLADRLKNLEDDIANRLARLENAETPLEIARIAMKTLTPAKSRDELLAQYRVVSGAAWPSKPTTAALRRVRDNAVDDATFVVEATIYEEAKDRERRNVALANAMKEIVNEHHFKVAKGERGTMKLGCMLNLAEPFQRRAGGWFEYAWDATCEIGANKPGAHAMLVAEESNTASSRNEGFSKKKAIDQSMQAMVRRMKKELGGYLAEGL